MSKTTSYKHIVWVDDFDNNNVSLENIPTGDEWDEVEAPIFERHMEDIRNVFGEKYASSVKLIMNIPEMLEFIDTALNKCDCVVLDINLNKSLDHAQINKIDSMCEKKGIKVNKDVGKNGGYYIYLYLLKSGFPSDRICMFTANKGDDNSTGEWEKIFLDAGIYPPKSIKRTDTNELQKWINELYLDEYYRVRKLVYTACDYWKKKLLSMKREDIAFNKIYYSKLEDKELLIEPATFINMLERIEMLYPIASSQNSSALYYQTLQVATIFHEESAKITSLEKDLPIRKYHQAVRNFRNWSSHNKFINEKIDAKLFAYILCVTFRSYFMEQDEQFLVNQNGNTNECYISYENDFFESFIDKSLNVEVIKKKYISAFKRHLNKLKKHDKKSKDKNSKNDRIPIIYECKDINDLLLCSGNVYTLVDTEKMYVSDVLLNILDCWIVQGKKYGNENNENGWEYKIEYYWDTEIKCIDTKCLSDYKHDVFKYLSYILFQLIA